MLVDHKHRYDIAIRTFAFICFGSTLFCVFERRLDPLCVEWSTTLAGYLFLSTAVWNSGRANCNALHETNRENSCVFIHHYCNHYDHSFFSWGYHCKRSISTWCRWLWSRLPALLQRAYSHFYDPTSLLYQ